MSDQAPSGATVDSRTLNDQELPTSARLSSLVTSGMSVLSFMIYSADFIAVLPGDGERLSKIGMKFDFGAS
ncbi:hypothetical protein SAMN02745225_02232 [Ferrithrix thermotolerans DSM 19514]|uniref:Uncharacterized protein n=1 Tax=Ferrithrix thermotolerans DSM 19514 TaxID=1121881 RepID=A0A1M4Y4Q4_9ACTN|nr:hypothetical protein [Ferrithrix thermotolerans]SHF00442.1 hypothetical protein SAMN02745225_02232 [Ferrithrix thermotolerans DSM 19514]